MVDSKFLVLSVVHAGAVFSALRVDQLADRGVPGPVILGAVKKSYKDLVDGDAEALRLKLITGGIGQAMEYQEAQAQALAALASPGEAAPERYPMLAASVGVDFDPETQAPAADVLGVARSVLAASRLWGEAGAAIRAARLRGKAEIDAAGSIDAAADAFGRIVWPSV